MTEGDFIPNMQKEAWNTDEQKLLTDRVEWNQVLTFLGWISSKERSCWEAAPPRNWLWRANSASWAGERREEQRREEAGSQSTHAGEGWWQHQLAGLPERCTPTWPKAVGLSASFHTALGSSYPSYLKGQPIQVVLCNKQAVNAQR